MSNIMNIVSIVFVTLLVIGFLIGIIRGWKRSLSRFVIVTVSMLVSMLVAPAISNMLLSKFSNDAVLTMFGTSIDFEKIIIDVLGADVANDLVSANSTTVAMAKALMSVSMNVVLFFAIFLVVVIISLFVYWIVCLVCHVSAKKKGTLTPKRAGNRLIGGLFGFLSTIVFTFALLTPVFGVMNICNKFLEREVQNSSETAQASAVSTNSMICGNLYYTEDEKIGKIETMVEKYADVQEAYNKSPLGSAFNALGISKLGSLSFDYLTTSKSEDMNVCVSDEIVALIRTYNAYKATFVDEEFDLAKNSSIDGILKIYGEVEKSEIVKQYMIELIPKCCDKWSNNEKFLGLECPVDGDLKPIFIDVLSIMKTDNFDRISSNIKAVLGVLKVANAAENQFITKIRDEKIDVVDYLTTNETFVEGVIKQLATTTELKNNLPIITSDALKLIYKLTIDEDTSAFENNALTNEQIAAINWDTEAVTIQKLSNKILSIIKTLDGAGENEMLNLLTPIGEVIDLSRTSQMLANPLQCLLDGFVNSNKVSLNENIKTQISGYLDTKWSESEFKFAEMFSAIQKTAEVAKNLTSSGLESITLNELSDVILKIVDNQQVKDTISELISTNIIENVFPDDGSGTVEIVTDMLDTFISKTTSETIEDDIAAGQQIVDILFNTTEGVLNLGETEADKQAKANEVVVKIVSSDAIMGMLDVASQTTGDNTAAIKDVLSSVSGDVSYIQNSIQTTEMSDQSRAVLESLFGAQA